MNQADRFVKAASDKHWKQNNNLTLVFAFRCELYGDNAGSPLLSAAGHQRSDHPAAAFHTAGLQGETP